jgi:ketosteroid isomerase-like protein
MPATTATETISEFTAYLAAGELDAAMHLYEDDCAFFPDAVTVAKGTAAVQAGLEGFFALRPTLTFTDLRVFEVGDLAFVIAAWKLSGKLPDGSPLELQGRGTDILRRQGDGTWRYVLDNPWGTALLDTAVSSAG